MIKTIRLFAVATALAFFSQSGRAAEPLTEKGLEKLMEEVGKLNKQFKQTQSDKNSAQMTKDATRLAEIFKQTVGFWQNRKVSDAVKWSAESETAAKAAATAAKAGEWDKVQAHLQSVVKNCKNCHEAHRTKSADGKYGIK